MDTLFSPANIAWYILAGVLLLLLVALLWYASRVAQPAPEREEVVGPPTGAAAMERKVVATFAMVTGMVLLFLGYGLREPARQAEAAEKLLDTSIIRGIELYTQLCFSCHGEAGQGAVVPDIEPLRLAPPLDRDDLRPTEADERRKRYDFIYKTIARGRPNTPMPAWSQTDGGALIDEQVNELTLMILNGDRQITFEGRTDTVWHHVAHVVEEHVEEGVAQMPKQPEVEALPFYQELTPQQQQGVKLILQYGCGSCHVIPNIPGAQGNIGPTLANIGTQDSIAGGVVPLRSIEDLAKWIADPNELKPGTAMPDLGVNPEQALAIASYLATLRGQ